MSRIVVGTENSAAIEIHYEDHGSGQPVVLIHGYPLNGASWEKQERALLQAGYRVITYDRRGFGKSSQPTVGYDYDTFASDLNAALEHVGLSDVVLVGFSMGTGEVVRYLSTYGSARVAKAVLMGTIPPFVLKTADNPEGVDGSVFDEIKAGVLNDRPAFFKSFLDNFNNVDVLGGTRISEQAWQNSFILAVGASPYAAHAVVDTWLTDFRDDLPKIDVPTLLIHGDADRILPYAATAARLPGLIKDLTVVTVEGGPHNIAWTHPEEVNDALLAFIAEWRPRTHNERERDGSTKPRSHDPSGNHYEMETPMSGTDAGRMNLEVMIIPVSDVDRAKEFYEQLGWRLDDDVAPLDGLRIVQFTPPGSGTSITFGTGLTTAAPGSAEGNLVVADIEAAHDGLAALGIDVSDVWHGAPFPREARQPGPDPERTSYGSFCSFNDPDDNLWLVQEVTTRRPGRD